MMNTNTDNTTSLFQVGQIRLAELSVFNWGSFNGQHTARIDAYGTLLTGGNGSGKSTFIDGLMALLLPAGKATFNIAAAQGDRSDRTLMSYMRGSYGSAHDGIGTRVKSKREKSVVTALRALYRGDDGSEITLAAIFWTTQASNALSDVKRIYAVAKRNVQLKEIRDAFGDGNARALKQWMRDDQHITCCDDNFSDYQELYKQLLHIENKNAPSLLARALGLKKIDDLTKLIRELVLEPSSVKDDARKVVSEFNDLIAIHNELVDARERADHLQKLPQLEGDIQRARLELESLTLEKNHLSIYFGEISANLWTIKIDSIKKQLNTILQDIKDTEQLEQDAASNVERYHSEYLQLGGDKIESLRKEVEYTKNQLEPVINESSKYQIDAKALGLPEQLTERIFNDNCASVTQQLQQIHAELELCQNQLLEAGIKLSESQQQIKQITDEIEAIKVRPDSNIDIKFQHLRDELVASLQIPAEQLIFIGELIDVQDQQRNWQGTIERALGGVRTTLLVPQAHYTMVTQWLNVRHTGLHVRVQVVRSGNKQSFTEFKTTGFLKKLVWRGHSYRDWLKQHLNRFDLECVSSVDILNATPFSMTEQGLIQMELGRFEKKDQSRVDDRRRWQLGFSNKSRLSLLNTDKQKLESEKIELDTAAVKARKQLDACGARKTLLQGFQRYQWNQINAPYWQKKVDDITADLKRLEQAGGDVQQAKAHWETSKHELSNIQATKSTLLQQQGANNNELKVAENARNTAQAEAEKGFEGDSRELLKQRVGVVSLNSLNKMAELLQSFEKKLEDSIERQRNKKNGAELEANGIMSRFRGKEKWMYLCVDWPTGLEGMYDFNEHLHHLNNEGLPLLVEQFKQRLNKHATQSLARIKTKLESEHEEILERIDTINSVLSKTEFREGSHLKLGSKKEKYAHVQDFEQKLRGVLSQVTSDDHEQRFAQLSAVVDILEKASNSISANTLESLRLLDSRYQLSFYAEEIERSSACVVDVLESSSGKSGGEKESFAGTIVAASLAYVLTPDGHDKPVYCTVFLDEAFSNTAETVSRRVLKVFKELNIHINLITPYKNLNLARESARSLLIAERDQDTHESHFIELTWEEIDRIRNNKNAELLAEAETLGMQIHNHYRD